MEFKGLLDERIASREMIADDAVRLLRLNANTAMSDGVDTFLVDNRQGSLQNLSSGLFSSAYLHC